MTPEERARRTIEEEAIKRILKITMGQGYEIAWQRGRASMREEAAKYIEVNSMLRKSAKELADGIRAIAVEESK